MLLTMRTLVRLPSCSAIREVQAEVCKEGSAAPTAPMTTPAVAPATGPAAPSMWHNLAGMGGRRWAGMGALAGGALGALMPGKDEDGESRGALSGALRGAMAGGIAGGLGGMAAKRMWGPTGAMKTMEGATQAGHGVVADQTAGSAAAAKAQTDLANRRAKDIYDPVGSEAIHAHAGPLDAAGKPTARPNTFGANVKSTYQSWAPSWMPGAITSRRKNEYVAAEVHAREIAAAKLQTKRDAELAAARAPAAAPAAAAEAPAAASPPAAPAGFPYEIDHGAPTYEIDPGTPKTPRPALPPALTPVQAPATQPPMGGQSAPVALQPLPFTPQIEVPPPKTPQAAAALVRQGYSLRNGKWVKTSCVVSPISVFSPKLAARRPFSAPKQTVAERVQGAFAPRKTKTDTAPVAAEAAEQPKAAPAAKPKEAPEAPSDDKKVAASPAVAATMPPGAGPATAVAPLKTSEVAVPVAAVVEPAKAAEVAPAAVAEPAIKVVKLAALAA